MAARRNGSLFLYSQITCLMADITRLLTEVYGDGVLCSRIVKPYERNSSDTRSTKLRRATVNFAMSVSVSVRLRMCLSVHVEQLGSQWTDFHQISHLRIFRKFIHSFSILSDDRSKASSKTMPPLSAIQSLFLQMRVSFPVLKVIQ